MGTPPRPGLLASLRQVGDAGLQLLQVRLALLGNELEEQKLRLVQGLVLGLLGALLLLLAFVLLCGLVVVLFWDEHRVAALVVLTALFGAGGALLLRTADRTLRSAGQMFSATLQELSRDRAALGAAQEPER